MRLQRNDYRQTHRTDKSNTSILRKDVDYYKNNIPEFLKENRNFSLEDFHQLPILSKVAIREHLNQIISQHFAGQQQRFARFNTSGSTGMPITI